MTRRVCDLETPLGQISRASKQLRESWEETKLHWRDQTCADFDMLYVQPLGPHLGLALSAVQKFAEVLRQAERECGEEDL